MTDAHFAGRRRPAWPVPSGDTPGGPAVGQATLRFRGAGAYAHLNLTDQRIAVPAGARGTWTVAYQADAWPIQPGAPPTQTPDRRE